MFRLLREYAEVSTIGGIVYLTLKNQPVFTNYFWVFTIAVAFLTGFYWCGKLYLDWQANPVISTIGTPGLPISQIPFPAVTFCLQGFQMDNMLEAINDVYIHFQIDVCGRSPQNVTSTLDEDSGMCKDLFEIKFHYQKAGPARYSTVSQFIEASLEAMVSKNLMLSAVTEQRINRIEDTSQELSDDEKQFGKAFLIYNNYFSGIVDRQTIIDAASTVMDKRLTGIDLKRFLQIIWNASPACNDGLGQNIPTTIFKSCFWKGSRIPCSSIFVRTLTDKGICCSANSELIAEANTNSYYTDLISSLQESDMNKYNSGSKMKTLDFTNSGMNQGLTVMLDANSNLNSYSTVDSDFQSMTLIITNQGELPLALQKGIPIIPGYRNVVALSAVQILGDDSLLKLNPTDRGCLFKTENTQLQMYQKYSQSKCYMECALNDVEEKVNCTPWFFPTMKQSNTCIPSKVELFQELFEQLSMNEMCSYCLQDCSKISFKPTVSVEPFRQCDEKNFGNSPLCNFDPNLPSPPIWGQNVIAQLQATGKLNYSQNIISNQRSHSSIWNVRTDQLVYDAYSEDIAVVNIYFGSATALQFINSVSQTWIDYLGNAAGIIGFLSGLCLVSLAEIIWLCIRIISRYSLKESFVVRLLSSAVSWAYLKIQPCTVFVMALNGLLCIVINCLLFLILTKAMPIDGNWTNWTDVSVCSLTCNGGFKNQTRSCSNPFPAHGGLPCSGSSHQSTICNTYPCPIDGNWGDWSNTTHCTVTCGNGTRLKTRQCNNPFAEFNGKECPGPKEQVVSCGENACVDENNIPKTSAGKCCPPKAISLMYTSIEFCAVPYGCQCGTRCCDCKCSCLYTDVQTYTEYASMTRTTIDPYFIKAFGNQTFYGQNERSFRMCDDLEFEITQQWFDKFIFWMQFTMSTQYMMQIYESQTGDFCTS